MILALLALAMPFPIHLHPHAAVPDERVALTLRNAGPIFRDLSIDGRTYTVLPGQTLGIVAPAGTRVLWADNMHGHHRGDVVLELAPGMHGVVKLD